MSRINNIVIGDQTHPVIDNQVVVWLNEEDQHIYTQKYGLILTPSNVTYSKFIQSGFLKVDYIDTIGEENDVMCSIFTEDGAYFMAGLITGTIEIYDTETLIKINEISVANDSIYDLERSGNLTFILTEDCELLSWMNITDINNISLYNYSLNDIFPGKNEMTNIVIIFMNVFGDRLYLVFNNMLSIYNITNQQENLLVFLNSYKIGFLDDLYFIYLYNYVIICSHNNGTTKIFNTESEITLIKITEFGSGVNAIFLISDGTTLFVSTNTSLNIYSNENFNFSMINSISSLNSSFSFTMSPDSELLFFINSLFTYIICDVSELNYSPLMTISSNTSQEVMYYQGNFHPDSRNIVLSTSEGIKLIRIVQENKNSQTPPLSFLRDYQDYYFLNSWWIDISPSQRTIYLVDNQFEIIAKDVNNYGFGVLENDGGLNESTFFSFTLIF